MNSIPLPPPPSWSIAYVMNRVVGSMFRGMGRAGYDETIVRGIKGIARLGNSHVMCDIDIALYIIRGDYVAEMHVHHPDAGHVVGRVPYQALGDGDAEVATDAGQPLTVCITDVHAIAPDPAWLLDA